LKTAENNLIEKTFRNCREAGRAAFVAYVAAGDPDYETSLKIVDTLVEAGIDILELGVPFSDPLADGEANQLAATRAIESGMTPVKVIEMVKDIRERHPELPIVFFTYLNPVAYSGDFGDFCQRAAATGVNSLLPLDLPPEESADYRKSIDDSGLKLVSLIAPTTREDRIPLLAKNAGSFIYYVCREGVTGERKEFATGVDEKVALIKKYTDLPVVVGFGISTPEHIKAAAACGVDGVVVGSAIVRKVEALSKGKGSLEDIGDFVRSLRNAIK
jgi:tryptophan synthase alpha chain